MVSVRKITPPFLLSLYHFILALFGAVLYGFPSRQLKVIGVTGTNGKTTTTEMIFKILEEAGYKTALINSIRFKIEKEEEPNLLKMTMPGRFFIQKFLRKAVNEGCQYAVLEVTSEGIKQHRHRFIKFNTAVFTNLSPEHIEAHGSFEKYREAKGKLFQACKNIHIINRDDPNAEYFLRFPCAKRFTFGKEDKDIILKSTKILGDFNAWNAACACKVGLSQGIDWKICKKAIEKVEKVPGRMEEVISEPFKVFVDYAFTPNALEKVYQTLKTLYPKTSKLNRKMICVLGSAGGGRDKWKRPVLGELAVQYCDKIIVTNEDPYDEDPMEIINQVAEGTKGKAEKILDRREAIKKSLELAKQNDIVVITGKGCEPWICVKGGKKIPWDDRKVIREEFQSIYSN
jgi:UDP-N-acetylmuramoyl-L-alanyl-D-glutamate--2,6-diaminopimelate ligase